MCVNLQLSRYRCHIAASSSFDNSETCFDLCVCDMTPSCICNTLHSYVSLAYFFGICLLKTPGALGTFVCGHDAFVYVFCMCFVYVFCMCFVYVFCICVLYMFCVYVFCIRVLYMCYVYVFVYVSCICVLYVFCISILCICSIQ